MIKEFGHIGIFVKSIEETIEALSKFVDVPELDIKSSEEMQLKAAVVDLNGIGLELIQDMTDNGLLAQFVKEKGDTIHHFCLLTDDIDSDIKKLEKRGVEMQDKQSRIGIRGKKIAMSMPTALNGVPIELSEP